MFLLSFNIVNAQWVQSFSFYGSINNISVAVSDTIVIIGNSGGGVHLSTNNGVTWTSVVNGLTNSNVNSLAINGTYIFVGTDNGVFNSSNYGNNWSPVTNGLPANSDIMALAIKGTNIFAGTWSEGVFISSNNGNSWSSVNNGLTNLHIKSFVTSGSNIFVGTGNGVFMSADNGDNWTSVSNGLPTNAIISCLAISDTNIFAGYWDGAMSGGVYLSTNNGANWSSINNGIIPNNTIHSFAIYGTNVFVGTYRSWDGIGGGVYLTTNNGSLWTPVYSLPFRPNVCSLALNGTYIFAGMDSIGVWKRPLSQIVSETKIVQNNSELILFPNPNNGKFTVNQTNVFNNIEVFNILGKLIYSSIISNGQNEMEINLSNVPKGIYFVKLDNGEQITTEKIIIN